MAEVPLFGKNYPLVGPSEFDLGELNDCENFFGAEFVDERINSRKLSAILFVSVRRVDPAVRVEDIRKLTPADLAAVEKALKSWQAEEDADPPAERSGEADKPEPSANGSSDSAVTGSASVLSSTGALS